MSAIAVSLSLELGTLLSSIAQTSPGSQSPSNPGPQSPFDPMLSIFLEVVVQFVITLIIGTLVLGVAPEWSKRNVDRMRSMPGESFLYGLLALVIAIGSAVVLVITIVGVLVLIPGLLVFAIGLLLASVLATVAVGTALVGGSSYWQGLVVGSLLVSLVSVVPVFGGILDFVLVSTGLGSFTYGFWKST